MSRIMMAMVLAGFAGGGCALWTPPSRAETVATEAVLRERPSAKAQALAVLAAGAELIIESPRQGASRDWTFVTVSGLRGYVASAALSPQSYASTLAAESPHCDLGYPYSGSSVYFTGLTELRTSEPLGALFGYHVQRPCRP